MHNSRPESWIALTLKQAAWAPLLVLAAFVVAAKVLDLYYRYPRLDVPTHLLGGVAITYFYQRAIVNVQSEVGTIPKPVQALLALTCTATTAVFWEILEYVSDRSLGTAMIRDVQDTLVDLIVGMLGGALWIALHRPSAPLTRSMSS